LLALADVVKLGEEVGGEKMALLKISIVPVGSGATSVSQYIARAVAVLEGEKDIKYELTAMGTIIEGDLDRLLSLARRMHEAVFDVEMRRAVTVIEIDDRRDKAATLSGKVESVKKKLGRKA
jgi:uncharacterized protein (TIGR00106 family)